MVTKINATSCINYNSVKHVFDSKPMRHITGRIDSIFRTATSAWVAALQLGKVVIKTAVCALTLGQLYRFNITKTWGYHGLECDTAMLLGMGYKTAIAFRDIIVAPRNGYVSTLPSLVTGLALVFGGEYHHTKMKQYPEAQRPQHILDSCLKADPFTAVTDKQYSNAKV